jgi:pimeloyl-ACP methyl ester carboxylesterase
LNPREDPATVPVVAVAHVNGVRLFFEAAGTGDVPVVLVHGSWDSLDGWSLLVPLLAGAFRVVAYDRRGHTRSERPTGQGSVREDVADLAALVEHLGLAPAWVIGNSFGAAIALRLAAGRPDLLRGVVAHEPPLIGLLADDPAFGTMLDDAGRRIGAVVARIAAGDHAGAAEEFVETVALGPGTWRQLPVEMREMLAGNAPTFLDETQDPETLRVDLAGLRRFSRPALLTYGDQSPPMFAPVIAKLAPALPQAEVREIAGVGHIPHATHPEVYAGIVRDFMRRHAT